MLNSVRTVVIVQNASSPLDVIANLRDAGWSATILEASRAALTALDSCAVDVGLMVLDGTIDIDALSHAMAESRHCKTQWIAVVGRQQLDDRRVREFVAMHCIDHHTLPIDLVRLTMALGHAAGQAQLMREVRSEPCATLGRFGLIGQSPVMLQLYRDIDKIASATAPVLITGESGTGKEKAARALHSASTRANQPFVAVNCAAVPTHLIQSELFGYEKGAFTGAYQRKIGSIEAAAGGVLFLDEIGDLAHETQATLLRFLQDHIMVRVGATTPIEVNVRVVAATNVDLSAAIAHGRFREDLFYRLNVLRVAMPPLRARGDDIALLARAFLDQAAGESRSIVQGFTPKAIEALTRHGWPGNVRELYNRVRKAVIMADHRLIAPVDLDLQSLIDAPRLHDSRQNVEREAVEHSLRRNRSNVSAAARELGISRVTLYRMLTRLGIAVR